jgi:hypothetical protein
MAVFTEPVTEADRKAVLSWLKQCLGIVKGVVVFIFFLLISAFFYSNQSMKFSLTKGAISDFVLAVLFFESIFVIIGIHLKIRKNNIQRLQTKKVFIGPITKSRCYWISPTLPFFVRYYIFSIDGKRFEASDEEYEKFNDNDILRIEKFSLFNNNIYQATGEDIRKIKIPLK